MKRDEVAVIKLGIDNVEMSMNNANGRRPSPIGRRRSSNEAKPVMF